MLLPFLTSCEMTEPEYYDAGYYHTVPPRAEIYGFDERPHDYRHPSPYHKSHTKTHGAAVQPKIHGHKQTHEHTSNQKQVVVKNTNQSNVHGHEKKKNQVVKHHPSESGSKVVVTE